MNFATNTDVRSRGALLTDAQGGASDAQINVALEIAAAHLKTLVGDDLYDMVLAFDSGSTDEEQAQKEKFTIAEAYFALSFLPTVLTNTQLEKTGYKKESQIGRSVTTYGNADDIADIADFWAGQGSKMIALWNTLSFTDEDTDEEIGMKTPDEAIGMHTI